MGDKGRFKPLKDALIQGEIIVCNDSYEVGKEANRYWLGENMAGLIWKKSLQLETFTITKTDKELAEDQGKEQKNDTASLTVDHSILDQALDYTANERGWSNDAKEYWRLFLSENWQHNVYPSITGRVYGSWATIPRQLRGVFLIDGEQVVEVDIKSAQPTFLVTLYKDRNSKECQKFIKMIQTGKIYEVIMKKMEIDSEIEVKDMMVNFLGGKKRISKLNDFFTKYFPVLFEVMKMINAKECKDKRRNKNGNLSRILQGIESDIIVNDVCQNYNVYTMHDAVICKKSEVELAKKAVKDAMFKRLGIEGKVKIDDKRAAIESYGNDSLTA